MERLGLPLYTMESKDPLTAFDAVGFTLQYELSYTNILAMLDLAGIWALRLEQELTIRGSAFWAANLLTGGFNLLPVPPLDGAQLASCLCEMRRAGKKFKGND